MARPKGVPNKRTVESMQEAEALVRKLGVDPFEILLMFAKGDWKGLGYETATVTYFTAAGIEAEKDRITPETRAMAAKEACQYLRPKLKAIEHSGPGGGALTLEALVVGVGAGEKA